MTPAGNAPTRSPPPLRLPRPLQVEAELLRRGIDPTLIPRIKQEYPGDLPEFVTRTEFLALTLRVGYQRAVALVQARLELQALENALRAARGSGTVSPVLQAARVRDVAETFRPTAHQTIRAAYLRGASSGHRALQSAGATIRFDVINPHAVEYAHRSTGTLITSINESQRDAVRALVEGAVATGRTVQETARDLRNIVGLRPDQVRALSRYRERVSARDLSADQIERKVERYAAALLKQRGELIARTEILTAANAGQLELWREARRAGTLDAGLYKQWIVTPDELLCPYCEPLDGVAVPLDELFQSDLGAVPHPPLHPNCRCTMGLVRVTPEQREAEILRKRQRSLKYSLDQPRDDQGRWTDGDGSGSSDAEPGRLAHMLDIWTAGAPGDFESMRDPKSELGKELLQRLDALPDYGGTVYRGVTMSSEEFDRLSNGKNWHMKLTSSFSKNQETPFDMMTPHLQEGLIGVILEARVHRGKDVTEKVPEEWRDQEEVILAGLNSFSRIDKPIKETRHGVTVYRVKMKENSKR